MNLGKRKIVNYLLAKLWLLNFFDGIKCPVACERHVILTDRFSEKFDSRQRMESEVAGSSE